MIGNQLPATRKRLRMSAFHRVLFHDEFSPEREMRLSLRSILDEMMRVAALHHPHVMALP